MNGSVMVRSSFAGTPVRDVMHVGSVSIELPSTWISKHRAKTDRRAQFIRPARNMRTPDDLMIDVCLCFAQKNQVHDSTEYPLKLIYGERPASPFLHSRMSRIHRERKA
jgi:hypothetical protein